MARVIQSTIKTPLADEVLFGRLKGGGTVRVVVKADDLGLKSLGFVYPEGPVLPRPERDIVEATRGKRPKGEPEVRRANGEGDSEPDAPPAIEEPEIIEPRAAVPSQEPETGVEKGKVG